MSERSGEFVDLPQHVREAIASYFIGAGLADHLGDVRDAERSLWPLIDPDPWDWESDGWVDDPWQNIKARLRRIGLLPDDYENEG